MDKDGVPVHHNYIKELLRELEEVLGLPLSFLELRRNKDGWVASAYAFGGRAIEMAEDVVRTVIDTVRRFKEAESMIVIDRNLNEVVAT